MIIPSSSILSSCSTAQCAGSFVARHAAPFLVTRTVAEAATTTYVSGGATSLSMVTAGTAAAAAFQALPVAISICGGGGSAATVAAMPFDLTRVRVRLEGLSAYSTIAALLMNAVLRLFSATPKRMKDATTRMEYIENVTKFLFTIFMALSVFCGSYTTIVFSLLGLYSKRALGLNLDSQCMEFFAATEDIRESGFDAFLVALVSFQASFVLSLFLNYHGKPRWFFLVAASIASFVCWWRWSTIMKLAATLLCL